MGARDGDKCPRCVVRKGQNLEEAGTGRFDFVDAIRELLGGRLGGRRFAEKTMGECPGRQGRGVVVGGESGDDVLGRIGVGPGGGQEIERRHRHAAIELVLNSWR